MHVLLTKSHPPVRLKASNQDDTTDPTNNYYLTKIDMTKLLKQKQMIHPNRCSDIIFIFSGFDASVHHFHILLQKKKNEMARRNLVRQLFSRIFSQIILLCKN